MKNLLTAFLTFTLSLGAIAEVPSLINYQGRLKEKSGTNVNGTKNFSLRIFDAKEGGQQIYEENVGAVVIKEGAYSFGFGEAGESILDFSESLIVWEDDKQIFDFTLSRTPVAESLSIEAREFKWDEKTGSSHVNDLLVQYDKNNKSTKVILLQSSMERYAALKFDYRVQRSGVIAGLASSQYNWLEITVDGETLSPRERLVSVPFAMKSNFAEKASISTIVLTSGRSAWNTNVGGSRPWRSKDNNSSVFTQDIFVPKEVTEIEVKLELALERASPEHKSMRAEMYLDSKSTGQIIVDGYSPKFILKDLKFTDNKIRRCSVIYHDDFATRFTYNLYYVIGR